jgi:hypothetical protein
MMKHFVKIFFATILAISSCCTGEAGGSSVVSGKVYHHAKPIANAKVYVKYDAKDLPSTDVSVYNQSVTAGADASYSISGLKCGDYYIYATGIDDDLVAPEDLVTGGLYVKIGKDGVVVEKDVYVTEAGHLH